MWIKLSRNICNEHSKFAEFVKVSMRSFNSYKDSLDRDIESWLRIKTFGFAHHFQPVLITYYTLFLILEVELFLCCCNKNYVQYWPTLCWSGDIFFVTGYNFYIFTLFLFIISWEPSCKSRLSSFFFKHT